MSLGVQVGEHEGRTVSGCVGGAVGGAVGVKVGGNVGGNVGSDVCVPLEVTDGWRGLVEKENDCFSCKPFLVVF
jgi:hypothetical protein